MIRTLRLQNFKAIRDVEVSLERLTVFVGPNGSGKTSFLQGLDLLTQLDWFDKSQFMNNFIFDKGYRDRYSLVEELIVSGSSEVGSIRFEITPKLRGLPGAELLDAMSNGERSPSVELIGVEDKSSKESGPRLAETFFSLGSTKLFRLDATLLAQPSSGTGESLSPDGRGLASFLAYLALNQPDVFTTIQEKFTEIIPSMKRIRFSRSQSEQRKELYDNGHLVVQTTIINLNEMIFDLTNGSTVTAQAASEGTLLVLAMIAVLMSQSQRLPKLILIDDLDRGLHPLAQRNLIGLIRDFLEKQPDLQIVATTHSPYLVGTLQPDEVRMTTLNDDGTVACGRLVDHPKFERWKNEMDPGEMWSMFGEKWVANLVAEVVR